MSETNDYVMGFEAYMEKRRQEAKQNGEPPPREPVNANYNSFVTDEPVDTGLKGELTVRDAYFARRIKDGREISFEQIPNATLGQEVWIVVAYMGKIASGTVELVEKEPLLSDDGTLTVLQDGSETPAIKLEKPEAKNHQSYKRVAKVKLRPKSDKDLDKWRKELTSKDGETPKSLLSIRVAAEGGEDVEEVAYRGQNDSNVFLGEEGEWFELTTCECSKYFIEEDFLKGPNVVNIDDSKVEEQGAIHEKIKAIILHRTAGSSIAGAIVHAVGTHFYAGTDGDIVQAVGLDKYTSHITNHEYRIAEEGNIKTENSIGIEVVGMAYYYKDDILYNVYGTKIEPSSVKLSKGYDGGVMVDGKYKETKIYWDELTEAQAKSVSCIIIALMKKYDLSKSDIFIHEEIQAKTAGEGAVVKEAVFNQLDECL